MRMCFRFALAEEQPSRPVLTSTRFALRRTPVVLTQGGELGGSKQWQWTVFTILMVSVHQRMVGQRF